jgi:hypothetical protein
MLQAAAAAAAAASGDGEGHEGETTLYGDLDQKGEDGVGIPHLLIDCSDKAVPAAVKVADMERLPTMEEVPYLLLSLARTELSL